MKTKSFVNKPIGIIAGVVILAAIIVVMFLAMRPVTNNQSKTNQPQSATVSETEKLKAIQPCELLNAADRTAFGLAEGELDDSHIRGCKWLGEDLTVDVSLYPEYTLAKMQLWENVTPEAITIGGYKAQRAAGPANTLAASVCQIDVEFSNTSVVRVSANGKFNETSERYCRIVTQVAEKIATKLH